MDYIEICTEGRNRTGTDVKCPRDFKSLVSTNFTTSATEASTRFELVHNGFADRSLTAWVRRQKTGLLKEALSERSDSNRRPSRWQRDALPAELLSQNPDNTRSKFYIKYLCITTFFITNDLGFHHHYDHVEPCNLDQALLSLLF